MPKLYLQITPKRNDSKVKNTDAEDTMPKKFQVTKVQRKVVDKNMTPQPARYKTDRPRKAIIPSLNSRRTENQPWKWAFELPKQEIG